MSFNYTVCDRCSRREENKPDCPYREMYLWQYLNYKKIPYGFKENGELVIDTTNLMNSSAMIELNNEIARNGYELIETGYDYKIVG